MLKAAIDLTTAVTNVKDAFNSLNGPMQRAYLELYGYASEGSKKRHNCGMLGELDRKVLAIYTPNAGVGSPRACVSIQLFWYSQNPQCVQFDTSEREVSEIRDVEASEELTVSYVLGICSRSERRARLSKWGFECTCSACEDTLDRRGLDCPDFCTHRRSGDDQPFYAAI